MTETKIILGIETSCDETSLAIIRSTAQGPQIISHEIYSHDRALKKWGGVVPELVARYHAEKLPFLFKAQMQDCQLAPKDISLIGVTLAPGLIGPLLTGLSFAKSLSMLHEIPILGVNHLFAHLEAIHLSTSEVTYPYLGCLFSGGHSLFVLIRSSHEWEFVGSTIDDAAGESLDKAGKLVGIDYPCGRIIDEIAPWGDPKKYAFPRPMAAKDYGIKMSFSGLKNAFRLKVEELNLQGDSLPKMWWQSKNPLPEFQKLYDLLASYQSAVMQSLFTKMQLAHKQVGNIPIVFGGGVACNSHLRTLVADWSAKQNAKSYFVSPIYCTDNGAMIANFAYRNQMMATPFPACLSLDAKSSTLLAKKDGLS